MCHLTSTSGARNSQVRVQKNHENLFRFKQMAMEERDHLFSSGDRDDELTIETGGLIGAILSKTLSATAEIAAREKIEFDGQKLPDAHHRVFDKALNTLLNGYVMLSKRHHFSYFETFYRRQWQLRRVVITKKGISFALMDHEDEIDFIPLAEVASIDQMCGAEDIEDNQAVSRDSNNRKLKQKSLFGSSSAVSLNAIEENDEEEKKNTSRLFVNAFQIATVPDGYNSGRSYYLQADSSQLKQEVMTLLQELAKSARKKANETTWFRRLQLRVREVYVHWIFQTSAALLIIAVCCS
jgi:predicted RNA-binding protein YlxR (DUF448 family)